MDGTVHSSIALALDSEARREKRAQALLPDGFDIEGHGAFAELLAKHAADGEELVRQHRAKTAAPAVVATPNDVEKLASAAVVRQTLCEVLDLVGGKSLGMDKAAAVVGYGLASGHTEAQLDKTAEAAIEKLAEGGVFESGGAASQIASGLGGLGSAAGQALGDTGLAGLATGAAGLALARYGLKRQFRNLPDAGLATNMRRFLVGLGPAEAKATAQSALTRESALASAKASSELQRQEALRTMGAAGRQEGAAMQRANRISDLQSSAGLSRIEAERFADQEMKRRGLANARRAQKSLGLGKGQTNVQVGDLAMPIDFGQAARTGGPVAGGLLGGALLHRAVSGPKERERQRPVIQLG